jgi:AcrR family transcriptional regulator
VSRWKPDARLRLQEAALELFHEHGYDQTTVADIAARAELTERTFFRYFTDKREVLFGGSESLQKTIVEGIAAAPTTMSPLEAVVSALAATASYFNGGKARSRKRNAVINAHAELRERQLIKMATIAAKVAAALHERGVAEPHASLAAQAGTAIFNNAFERWIADRKDGDYAAYVHAALRDLRAVTRSA